MILGSNVFFSAYFQADFFGKMIFLGLFTLSVICWVILIQKVWLTKRVKRVSFAFQASLNKHREQLLDLDLAGLPRPTKSEIPHPFAHIFSSLREKTVEVLNKNHYFSSKGSSENGAVYLTEPDLDLIESYALTAVSKQSKLLSKNIFVLATIVTLAPFLGLLGTVWGILLTFSELQTGATIGSNQVILGGLSMALATTVLGLLIAIPALIAYNYLKNSMKDFSSDMEDFLYSMLSTLELQYRKVESE